MAERSRRHCVVYYDASSWAATPANNGGNGPTWQWGDELLVIFARDIPSTGGNVGTADAYRADRTGTPLNPRTIAFEATFRY